MERGREMEFNRANVIYGVIATFFTAIFGKYWFLFVGFLVLNFVDYVTGWIKAKYFKKNESSKIGAEGILKKVMYWCVIGIAFFVSTTFVELGGLLNINLSFVVFFGYFTLATYLINEIRSILENFVEMGVKVPGFLTHGLEVASKKVDNLTKTDIAEDE